MNDLSTLVQDFLARSVGEVNTIASRTSHELISDNLITQITCSYGLCSDHLTKFSKSFNDLLNVSHKKDQKRIEAFVLESGDIFRETELLFSSPEWSVDERVSEFNTATQTTSKAMCTPDGRYYIIRCYDFFFYIFDVVSNVCVMVVKDEKKSLTMINVLLLTPYLTYGDLYAVHGGLVSNGVNNVLLSNSSLGGKTTFAILFLANGWKIVTEETTYITKEGKVLNYNIRNYFNIRAGTYLEFKDFFLKAGIVNDQFLEMQHLDNEELFELGKKDQMMIYFDTLSKNTGDFVVGQITHILNVSIDKDQSGMIINVGNALDGVDRFLELSLAPTVMLFSNLTNKTDIDRDIRKEELTRVFQKVKSYTVSSGFDYRNNFAYMKQKVGLI